MRLVPMGTGPFGVPTFRSLYDTDHQIVAVVTGPLRSRGRRAPAPGPVRQLAEEQGTPIFDPQDVNGEEARARLSEYGADLLVVCDYGQILSAETLATTRLGGVNLHGSLLPKYRGAAPINWAVYHGETETGVSVIHMTPKVDAGPVIEQARTPIAPDETAADVEARLSQLGPDCILRAIEALDAGRAQPVPQDPALASKAPDVALTTEKGVFTLSHFRNRVIYLDFWASWCVPCRHSFPWLNEMSQKYADKGFMVIAVNLDKDKALMQRFLNTYPAGFIVAHDPDGKSAEKFHVKGMPSSYLISPEGEIMYSHIGFREKDKPMLEEHIKSILNQSLGKEAAQ